MKFSKKQITKAGKILLTSKSQDEVNDALEQINDWRSAHFHPLRVMKNALIRLLKNINIEPVLVSQRLKRLNSIIYKLDINENMGLGGMQDIGGYRAVLKDTKDLATLKNFLLSQKSHHKLLKINNYVENPKDSGYRSIHFVYSYTSKNENYNDAKIELQIRTKLQHSWATAVETAGIITNTPLKSSQGSEDWLEFFKLVSSLFAIKEKLPILKEHEDFTTEQLMVRCYKLSKKLNVIDVLRALNVSTNRIEKEKFSNEFYLLLINLIEKRVRITGYKKEQFNEATETYLNIEKSIKNNASAVVFVSVSSLKALKKAYPSYFLDTKEFVLNLEMIMKNCETNNLI